MQSQGYRPNKQLASTISHHSKQQMILSYTLFILFQHFLLFGFVKFMLYMFYVSDCSIRITAILECSLLKGVAIIIQPSQ